MDNDGQNHLMPGLKKGEIWDYETAADAAELWDKDEEMTDSVNQQIQKAQKTNQWGIISGDFQEIITASLKIPMDTVVSFLSSGHVLSVSVESLPA